MLQYAFAQHFSPAAEEFVYMQPPNVSLLCFDGLLRWTTFIKTNLFCKARNYPVASRGCSLSNFRGFLSDPQPCQRQGEKSATAITCKGNY